MFATILSMCIVVCMLIGAFKSCLEVPPTGFSPWLFLLFIECSAPDGSPRAGNEWHADPASQKLHLTLSWLLQVRVASIGTC